MSPHACAFGFTLVRTQHPSFHICPDTHTHTQRFALTLLINTFREISYHHVLKVPPLDIETYPFHFGFYVLFTRHRSLRNVYNTVYLMAYLSLTSLSSMEYDVLFISYMVDPLSLHVMIDIHFYIYRARRYTISGWIE